MGRLIVFTIGTALATVFATANAGCSSMTPEERAAEERREAHEQELNSLWRSGYGFNNPNPERRREGLEPVDFYPSK